MFLSRFEFFPSPGQAEDRHSGKALSFQDDLESHLYN
jgi:hypothetical protein